MTAGADAARVQHSILPPLCLSSGTEMFGTPSDAPERDRPARRRSALATDLRQRRARAGRGARNGPNQIEASR